MKSSLIVALSVLILSHGNSTGNTRGNGAIEYRDDFNIMQEEDVNMVNSAPQKDCIDYYTLINQSLAIVSSPRSEVPGSTNDLIEDIKSLLKTDPVALKLHNIFARTPLTTLCLGWNGLTDLDLNQIRSLKENGSQSANEEIFELSIAEFLRVVQNVKDLQIRK